LNPSGVIDLNPSWIITLTGKINQLLRPSLILPVPHAAPSVFIFVMVFVPPLMQHIVFGLLALVKLMIWSKPKTKELPRPRYKNPRQK